MGDILHSLGNFILEHSHTFRTIGWAIVKIIILFIFAKFISSLLIRIISHILAVKNDMDANRKKTLEILLGKIIRYFLYFIFLLTILPIFGVDIKGLVAGAGVAGIAIAFGAQSLLKDFFNGFFILFENQFDVGDYVAINNNWGEVRSISPRLTELKIWTGEIVFIPNGEIKQVINYSKENSIAVIDVEVGYKTGIDKATEIIRLVMDHLHEEDENIVGDVSILGVQSLNHSTYKIRAIAECHPYTHWDVQRHAKERIQSAFTREGIDLPIQKMVYMHEQPDQDSSTSFD